MNEPAESLFRKSGKPLPVCISDIDPAIQPPFPDDRRLQTITVGKRARKVLAIPAQIAPRKKGWLFLFETPEILRRIDFDTFLDYIDDAIVIANREGFVEHYNEASLEMTRLGIRGLSFYELVRMVKSKNLRRYESSRRKRPKRSTFVITPAKP